MSESGQAIKRLREERFLKPSDIERLSGSIANAKLNKEYYISHATLADIEAGAGTSIYKVFSLAVAFKLPYTQLLWVFGIDAAETERFELLPESQTVLEPMDLTETDVSLQFNFDNRIDARETNLLTAKPEEWGIVPSALLKRLQPKRFIYALVGLDDDSMGDIIPAGSLIEVDKDQNKVQEFTWRTLRERPIYLVWHDHGYGCGWCQMDRSDLMLVPHPASIRPVMRLNVRDVSIVGRVVHAWCSLQPSQRPTSYSNRAQYRQ